MGREMGESGESDDPDLEVSVLRSEVFESHR